MQTMKTDQTEQRHKLICVFLGCICLPLVHIFLGCTCIPWVPMYSLGVHVFLGCMSSFGARLPRVHVFFFFFFRLSAGPNLEHSRTVNTMYIYLQAKNRIKTSRPGLEVWRSSADAALEGFERWSGHHGNR